jgi:hypothetical protein
MRDPTKVATKEGKRRCLKKKKKRKALVHLYNIEKFFHYIVRTVKKSWETMPAKHLHYKETMQINGSTIMLDKKRFHVWIHLYEVE